jgi:hypothetical protein
MRRTISIMTIIILAILIIGCGPVQTEKFADIKTNETAFVIPLEGESKSGQAKFFSEEYLKENKVPTKRISLSQRKKTTGRWSWNYEWIPTVTVITVDRSPITREWTSDATSGTSNKNQALYVESADSIGFGVGIIISASILEEDTPRFLYRYGGKPLADIIDNNVRGRIGAILSREFAKYDLETGRRMKNDITKIIQDDIIPFFKQDGITISSVGLAEGLVYEDKEIQNAINKKFTAEMQIQIETQNNIAQAKVNERNVGIAEAAKRSALEFKQAAEAQTAMVELEIRKMKAQAALNYSSTWDGKLPEKMIPEGVGMMFLDQDSKK